MSEPTLFIASRAVLSALCLLLRQSFKVQRTRSLSAIAIRFRRLTQSAGDWRIPLGLPVQDNPTYLYGVLSLEQSYRRE
eukprot:scaffold64187_cov57-Attheya_sp.AAC.3